MSIKYRGNQRPAGLSGYYPVPAAAAGLDHRLKQDRAGSLMDGFSDQGSPASDQTQPEWMQGFIPTPVPGRGRWEKGQSGNPRGRPPGRPDARMKVTQALMGDAPAIARVVIDAALEGDLQACNIVLSRIAPAVKPQAERVAFGFDPMAPVPQQIEAVLAAVAAGVLAPDSGQTIIAALGTLADARAAADLEARIITLEAKQA